MKFKDFKYQRPNIEQVKNNFEQLLEQFKNANSADQQSDIMQKINKIRSEFDTMGNIAQIKYSIDTTSKENEEEQNFFDTNSPIFWRPPNRILQSLSRLQIQSRIATKMGRATIQHCRRTVTHLFARSHRRTPTRKPTFQPIYQAHRFCQNRI